MIHPYIEQPLVRALMAILLGERTEAGHGLFVTKPFHIASLKYHIYTSDRPPYPCVTPWTMFITNEDGSYIELPKPTETSDVFCGFSSEESAEAFRLNLIADLQGAKEFMYLVQTKQRPRGASLVLINPTVFRSSHDADEYISMRSRGGKRSHAAMVMFNLDSRDRLQGYVTHEDYVLERVPVFGSSSISVRDQT